MSDKKALNQVADNMLVTMDYTLTVEDRIVDSSKDSGPIRFVQGNGEIIPGLERQLDGMALGAEEQIIVSPDEGYGEFDEDKLVNVPRNEFAENIPLDLGVNLKMRDQDGNLLHARIHAIGDDFVSLNFNHMLAGKELKFDVTILELRTATAEEMENGYTQA